MLRDAYVGEEKVARIYTGDKIVHPSPVMDGLVLWYDFMGRKNSDAQRAVAEDLSGNGNDGALVNFAYQEGSGYEDGLRFDGVDDYIRTSYMMNIDKLTSEILLKIHNKQHGHIISTYNGEGVNLLLQFTGSSFGVYAGANIGGFPIDNYVNHIYISITVNKKIVKIYYNGIEVMSRDMAELLSMGNLMIGNRNNLSRPYSGDIFATRAYNRALTPEEIAHNYAMEKERWNL